MFHLHLKHYNNKIFSIMPQAYKIKKLKLVVSKNGVKMVNKRFVCAVLGLSVRPGIFVCLEI